MKAPGTRKMTTTQALIEDAINRRDVALFQITLSSLKGEYAAKYMLKIIREGYKTDEWIKSVLEMLP